MVFVTGGTGLVGIHLLMELSELPQPKIVATYRSEKSLAHAFEVFKKHNPYKNAEERWTRIYWVKANITDVPELTTIFKSYTISQVYHCAGYVTFQTSVFNQLKKINIEGTANLVNLSIDFGVQKFCYVSSIATLNLNAGQTVFDETSQWNSEQENSGYAISKYGGEMEVWRGSEEGLSVIIVHPGVIIGKGFSNGSSEIFEKIKKGMPLYTLGSTGYISAFDVVKAMIALMESKIKNDNFILVSENVTHKTTTSLIANTLGKTAPKVKANQNLVKLVAQLEELLDSLFNRKPLIGKDMVPSLFSNHQYSSKKIKNSLGIVFEKIDEVIIDVSKTFLGKID